MSLFKSKRGRRNIRKKAVELEEEGVEGEKEGTEATDVLATNGETRPPPSQTNISTAPTKKYALTVLVSRYMERLSMDTNEIRTPLYLFSQEQFLYAIQEKDTSLADVLHCPISVLIRGASLKETSFVCCEGRKEARSLLSFEDELADEGPEFRVKKTTLSRRAAKMAGKDRKEKKHKKKRET